MDVTAVVISGAVGLACGLSKDIMFSWLTLGRTKQPMSDQCASHREKLGRIEERLGVCESELAKGSAMFRSIQVSMDGMSKSLAVLLDRSNQRRKDDDGLR